jgi:hypothetical protein
MAMPPASPSLVIAGPRLWIGGRIVHRGKVRFAGDPAVPGGTARGGNWLNAPRKGAGQMTSTNSQQETFADGMSKFAEAARHSMTASRLAAAGTVALGAATYFYFADPARREAAMQSANRMFDSLTSWWQGPSGRTPESSEAAANPGAPTGVG